jgi:hypothetical protein
VAAGAGSAPPPALVVDELVRLLVDVVRALDAAHAELIELSSLEDVPMPEGILKELEQRDALAATMARLPEGLKEQARKVFAEEFAKAVRTDDGPAPRVDGDVMREVDEAFELVRRARLVNSELDLVLREAGE